MTQKSSLSPLSQLLAFPPVALPWQDLPHTRPESTELVTGGAGGGRRLVLVAAITLAPPPVLGYSGAASRPGKAPMPPPEIRTNACRSRGS
ncbi:hypothetical protein LCGC14_1434440 [marine sediment metagenome]|uniref:Uncharacterized protein n=1 Tax=marine sediment metagenome TaxID=412755 RepID=A0A0F9JN39_9ZZZZ